MVPQWGTHQTVHLPNMLPQHDYLKVLKNSHEHWQSLAKWLWCCSCFNSVTFPCHAFWISPYGHSFLSYCSYGLPNSVIVHHTHDLTSGSLYTQSVVYLFSFCHCLLQARISFQNRYLSPRKSKTAFLPTFGFIASTEKACIWNVVVVLTSSKDEDKSLPWYVLSDSELTIKEMDAISMES